MKYTNQKGFAHPAIFILAIALVTVVGLAGWRATQNNDSLSSQKNDDSSSIVESLPEGLDGIKTIEEVSEILGESEDGEILEYKLESSDDGSFYVIEFSNGKKITVNARTGEVVSRSDDDGYEDQDHDKDEDEDEDSDEDDSRSSTKVAAKISMKEAYRIAIARYNSPVDEIELEREDDKATYKIEYKDGSKIEIDATSGKIVKADIEKASSEDDDEDDKDEDDDEDDDKSDDSDED